jgi:hypothetical protein
VRAAATLAPANAQDVRFHDAQGRVTPALSAFAQTGHQADIAE